MHEHTHEHGHSYTVPQALLTDAGHNLGDVASLGLSLYVVPQNVQFEEVEKAINAVAGVKQVSHISHLGHKQHSACYSRTGR